MTLDGDMYVSPGDGRQNEEQGSEQDGQRPNSKTELSGIEDAAERFLAALGVDLTTPGTVDTARRMARAYSELLTPIPLSTTTFPNKEGYSELVLERRIPFTALCEHHFLPFSGHAYLGYLPAECIIGLSKLTRLVQFLARSPEVQERLTQQIADWLYERLRPRGVGVVVVAEHQCVAIRGVRASGTTTVTSALHGDLRTDWRQRREFFQLTGAMT